MSKNLNPQQLEAVKKINGPVMIIAGPGSGKQEHYRKNCISVRSGIDPKHILALTFTNKPQMK